jgi:2-dehydropantoate 2-reductase
VDDHSNRIEKVCVYGVGGVGGYFGGKIAEAATNHPGTLEVYFIARGNHLQAIKQDGLRVMTPEKTITAVPTLTTDNLQEIPTPDLILFCVKSYDLDQAVDLISTKVKEKTVLVPLLNGADIYERILARLPGGMVLPACVYIGTHIEKPGVIRQKGGEGIILFGRDPRRPELKPERVIEFFSSVGIRFQYHDDPSPAIWGKYIFIAAFGLVTVYTGKTLGEILEDPDAKELVRNVMVEIKTIAGKKGIPLPEDIVEASIRKASEFPYETKTSYQRDVELKGSLNEGDLYGGTILREGERYGIPTPVTRTLYSTIQQRINA